MVAGFGEVSPGGWVSPPAISNGEPTKGGVSFEERRAMRARSGIQTYRRFVIGSGWGRFSRSPFVSYTGALCSTLMIAVTPRRPALALVKKCISLNDPWNGGDAYGTT